MRRFWLTSYLLPATIALLNLACGGSASVPTAATTPAPRPAPSPKVAVLSVDGLRPDALSESGTPNMLGLASRGAFTWKAQTVFPSMTLPAHASMLTGLLPTSHGVTWDDYRPEKGTVTVHTVFALARRTGLRTVAVVGKDKLRHLNAPGTIDSFVLTKSDAETANEAIIQVQAGFDLMLVHFPDTDLAGHAKGWLSAFYLEQVTAADQAIGRLLAALPRETTVILTADHGGHGTTHGSSSLEDMTIPWIMVGPRVRVRGYELARPVRTVDTAATVLHVLGLPPPPASSGVVVDEAFE